jgi:methionyl-tRNA formyltransferase
MRVLFFGTAHFAVPTLESLFASHNHSVIGVVSQPDRPSGRGLQLQESPVKRAALSINPELPILQPEKARTREFREQVEALAPDALVVAAFGQILSQRLLDGPQYGGINVHGSLLPRWRGAAPMQYALIAGDTETGVTTMQMDAGMDTGDILLKASVPIDPDDTAETIERKLSTLGAPLLIETLDKLELGTCPREVQDSNLATFCPPLSNDAGTIDWTKSASSISNLIRGVTPRPGAWLFFGGKGVKVWQSKVSELSVDTAAPGTVVSSDKGGITIAAGDGGAVLIEIVQPEGKPRMNAAEWANGARIKPGIKFDSRQPSG